MIDDSLSGQGFRLTARGGVIAWRHPAEVRPTDTDCTDMTDDEFEQFVIGLGVGDE